MYTLVREEGDGGQAHTCHISTVLKKKNLCSRNISHYFKGLIVLMRNSNE